LSRFIIWFVKITGFLPEVLYFKRKVYYENRKRQSRKIKGPAIIAANHTSLLDFVVLFFTFFGRSCRFVAAEVVYESGKLMPWFLKVLGAIRVDRSSGDVSFLATSIDTLKKGGVVIVFPESRLIKDGDSEAFKPSVVYMALQSGAPVIPVWFEGKYGLFKRAKLMIGEKMYLGQYCDTVDPSPEKAKEIAGLLQKKIFGFEKQVRIREKVGQTGVLNLRWFVADFVRITAWPLMRLAFGTKYRYLDGATRKIKGSAILIGNHKSYWDPVMMSHAFTGRRVRIVAADSIFESGPLMNWFMRSLGCIKISREAIDLESFNYSLDVLRAGGIVGLFPEGRIKSDGEEPEGGLLPFKPGAALLALSSGAPVIPFYTLKPCRIFKRQEIIVGRPLDLSVYDAGGFPSPDTLEKLTEELHSFMQSMPDMIREKEAAVICKNQEQEEALENG